MRRSTYLLTGFLLLAATAAVVIVGGMRRPPVQAGASLPATAPVARAPANTATPSATTRGIAPRAPLPEVTTATTRAANPLEPSVHDPVMIKQDDYFYVFYTGGLINELRSKDLIHWERLGRTFPGVPDWVAANVPANRGDLWAPDISLYKGKYYLFYTASTFGSRNSGIGLATTKTLNPAAPDFKWSDDGMIVRSQQSDNFNAIDPNFVLDENGQPWLTFGSFWSGIKLIKLADDGMKQDPKDATIYSIAARKPPETAIEAPFIIRQGNYFYLFVSWDRCCQGVRSTYRIMVGRSLKITGPYLDKEGVDMKAGGGTQLLAGDGQRIIGPGHNGMCRDGDRWLMVHHFYDGTSNGTSRLQIREVTFDDKAWPVLGKPLNGT